MLLTFLLLIPLCGTLILYHSYPYKIASAARFYFTTTSFHVSLEDEFVIYNIPLSPLGNNVKDQKNLKFKQLALATTVTN